MSVAEELLQGAREWLKVAISALSDSNLIPADDDGPRPDLPYMVVRVDTHNVARHVKDERLTGVDGGGAPTVKMRGHRRGTIALSGFGADSEDWLDLAGLTLGLPSVQAQLDLSGFTATPVGPTQNLSGLVDTGNERRYARDFDVTYLVETDPETQIEHLSTELDLTLIHREDDPDPLVATLTTE